MLTTMKMILSVLLLTMMLTENLVTMMIMPLILQTALFKGKIQSLSDKAA